MKRQHEKIAYDERRARRDEVVGLVSHHLQTHEQRRALTGILPAAIFSELVRLNADTLHFDAAEARDILRLTGTASIVINTEELFAWRRSLPTELEPIGDLLLQQIYYVSWPEFLHRFDVVLADVTGQMAAAKRDAPHHTITILYTSMRETMNIRNWLAGYAWYH